MFPRRRTLWFILLLLSLNNGLVASVAVGPVSTEYYPCSGSSPLQVNSVLTVPGAQTAFPTQLFNEVFPYGSYPLGLSINAATINYGVSRPCASPTYSTYAPIETLSPLPIVKTITETLAYPSNVEFIENYPPYPIIKNYPPCSIIENYPPVTQTFQVEGCTPTAIVAEIYQTPITVQIPSMPRVTPFIAIVSPNPEVLKSKNIINKCYTATVVPKICPQICKTEIVPVKTTTLNIPSCDVGCGSPQLPVTLQINLAPPLPYSEPIIAVISQPAPTPTPFSSFNPSFEMLQAPPPIIMMENSKSKLSSNLPILLLTLFDGGCGYNGGGGCSCSQCSACTPLPFPIVIPTNSPVIIQGKSKEKKKGNEKKKDKGKGIGNQKENEKAKASPDVQS